MDATPISVPDIITIVTSSEDERDNDDDDIIFVEDVKGTGAATSLSKQKELSTKKNIHVESRSVQPAADAVSSNGLMRTKPKKSPRKKKKKQHDVGDGAANEIGSMKRNKAALREGEPLLDQALTEMKNLRKNGTLHTQKLAIHQDEKINVAVNLHTLEAPGQSIPALVLSSLASESVGSHVKTILPGSHQIAAQPSTYNGLFMNVNVRQPLPKLRATDLRFKIGAQQPPAPSQRDEAPDSMTFDPQISFEEQVVRITNAAYWLLLPKNGMSVVLAGIARFKCYAGIANIAGYVFSPEKEEIVIPSFSSESYVSLFGGSNAVQIEDFEKRADSRFERIHYLECLNTLQKFPDQISAILLVSSTNSVSDPLLWHAWKLTPSLIPEFTKDGLGASKFAESKQLFAACILKAVYKEEDKGDAQSTDFSVVDYQAHLWREIAQEINMLGTAISPVILLCGSKNVGKSTTVRFILNSLLEFYPAVQCLDCDIGQSEFNPPGCISIHTITVPVFGPPFARLHEPDSCGYVGSCDAGSIEQLYRRTVPEVFKAGREQSLPLVVNTMGWITGLGKNILRDVSSLTRPSLIIDLIQNDSDRVAHALSRSPNSITRTYVSDVKKNDVKKSFTPAKRRKLSQLMYLCRISPSLSALNDVTPYRVSFRDISLCFSDPNIPSTHYLVVLLASYVGLAVWEKGAVDASQYGPLQVLREIPVCRTLGFGVVRAIDTANELCYLLTPLPLTELDRVNLLIRGSITTPDEIFLDQHLKNYEGPVPKVAKV